MRRKVKNPESEGRSKENREADRSKETTDASEQRAKKHGQKSAENEGGRQSGKESRSASKSEPRYKEKGGQSEDLKSREYEDQQGNIHHHTKTYMEQHRDQPGEK